MPLFARRSYKQLDLLWRFCNSTNFCNHVYSRSRLSHWPNSLLQPGVIIIYVFFVYFCRGTDWKAMFVSVSNLITWLVGSAPFHRNDFAIYRQISFPGWLVLLWNFCCITVVQHQLRCLWSYFPGLCAVPLQLLFALSNFAILIALNWTSFLSL